MTDFYRSKKKFGKKMLQKLQNLKMHNLENLMDDYFYKICYAFYMRQMQIWCLLRHKYLQTAKIGIQERRF